MRRRKGLLLVVVVVLGNRSRAPMNCFVTIYLYEHISKRVVDRCRCWVRPFYGFIRAAALPSIEGIRNPSNNFVSRGHDGHSYWESTLLYFFGATNLHSSNSIHLFKIMTPFGINNNNNNNNVPVDSTRHQQQQQYCFLDVDIDQQRAKLATAAAFVDETNSRYGFSSKHLLSLGGSELSRIPELIENDHEWSSTTSASRNNTACGGILTKPPACGNRVRFWCRSVGGKPRRASACLIFCACCYRVCCLTHSHTCSRERKNIVQMILRLFWDVAPLACENFATLCGNGSVLAGETIKAAKSPVVPLGESGKPLTFRKSKFHRVIPGFVMQGGDFVFQNGTGGESIFGKKFKDERAGLQLKHNRRGVLSMGNSGKNSNGSQFFLTFDKAPQCDGKHVIFGELVSGFEILDAVEQFGTVEGEPTVPISITDCGIYVPLQTPACGYHYDTPDSDSFTGISSVFVVRPRVLMLVPSPSASEKFATALGNFVSIVDCIVFSSDQSTTTPTSSEQVGTMIMDMLGKFAADVVIVAPACWNDAEVQKFKLIRLPQSWQGLLTGNEFEMDQVVLVAKPMEALTKIHTESWLRKQRPHWQLDGTN